MFSRTLTAVTYQNNLTLTLITNARNALVLYISLKANSIKSSHVIFLTDVTPSIFCISCRNWQLSVIKSVVKKSNSDICHKSMNRARFYSLVSRQISGKVATWLKWFFWKISLPAYSIIPAEFDRCRLSKVFNSDINCKSMKHPGWFINLKKNFRKSSHMIKVIFLILAYFIIPGNLTAVTCQNCLTVSSITNAWYALVWSINLRTNFRKSSPLIIVIFWHMSHPCKIWQLSRMKSLWH